MAKKWIKLCVPVVILGCLLFYLYPQSMKHIIETKENITIICMNDAIIDGKPSTKTEVYEISKQTDCYQQIMELCSDYTYHRYYKTLFPNNGMTYKEREVAFSFHIYRNEKEKIQMAAMCGDGRILMNQRLYKMDYFGNRKQTKFMKELKAILDIHPELLQKD